ncbi:MAG: YqaJ viral recombinase family protein [bacterium]
MPITQWQRENRWFLGGSDITAVVFGYDGFGKSSWDVWARFTYNMMESAAKEIFKRGDYMEEALLLFGADRLGPIIRNQRRVLFKNRKKGEFQIGADTDALVRSTGNPFEAKSVISWKRDEWGSEESDEVPEEVFMQNQVELMCSKRETCHTGACFSQGFSFEMFHIHAHAEIQGIILEKGEEFWQQHILTGIPPESIPSANIIRRICRQRHKVTYVDFGAYNELQRLKDLAKQVGDELDLYDRKFKGELGDAELVKIIEWIPCGRGGAQIGEERQETMTFIMGDQERVDTKALREIIATDPEKYGDLKEKVFKTSRFPTLRNQAKGYKL